jgi:hypothetical protein
MSSVSVEHQPLVFLEALFRASPDDLYILIWTLPDKQSYWFQHLDEAAAQVRLLGRERDTYVGMALAPRIFTGRNGGPARCPAHETAGIGALWADIDVAEGGAHKKNVFASRAEALEFVRALPLEPTMIVDSGYGFHLYWCFKEPWVFLSAADRMEAEVLAIRWRDTLKERGRRAGRVVDSVGDLARVMRVPGTFNFKRADDPQPCNIVSFSDERRYDPSEFEEFLIDTDRIPQIATSEEDVAAGADFVLDPQAAPPRAKWEALQELDPRVKLSFAHKRRDMPDQSASAYDMSLASFAANVGWTRQEIVNLLIFHRRSHGEDLKLRYSYYVPTLAAAMRGIAYERALEALDEVSTAPPPPPVLTQRALGDLMVSAVAGETPEPTEGVSGNTPDEAPDPHDENADGGPPAPPLDADAPNVIDVLEAILRFRIARLIKYVADEPVYVLETDRGTITLGAVENLIDQTRFRNKVAALVGVYVPILSKAKWAKVAQHLLNLCVVEGIGEENTEHGRTELWIADYLASFKPASGLLDDVSLGDLAVQGAPFILDGYLHVFLGSIEEFLFRVKRQVTTSRMLGVYLKGLGFEPARINCRIRGARTSRSVWRYPWNPQ